MSHPSSTTPSNTMGLAVITGASSGIGAVYADRLARRGYDLLLIARNQQRLEQLATRIRTETGRRVDVLGADLSKTADLARVERLLRDDPRVTLLINNAGVGAIAPLMNTDVDTMSHLIALNVDALMRLTYAIVPGFVARRAGTIINIASIVAVAPEILNGVYGGSKAFVLAFSQSLRHELANTGVRVQVVLPGATATDFWNSMGKSVDELPQEIVMSVDDLVDAAIAGLDQGEFVTVPALPEAEQWEAFEGARQALMPNLSRATAAPRYAGPRVTA
jgi:short-subunit dehydrogenase